LSNAAVETTLQIAEGVSRGVVGGGYPIMSGHSGVRNVANFNRENSGTPEQLKRIACLGGMFGLGTDGAKATDWAHDGMLADFVKDVRTAPTSQAMAGKDLVDNHRLHSADYFYRMWQKVEAQKRNVQ
jgi:hypothetical protein